MKNIWPIALIAFFIVMITGLVSFGIWSGHQSNDLVSENYYADELRFQQRIEAVARTKAEGLVPVASFDAKSGNVDIRFPTVPTAAKGTVKLYRPSEAALDREVELMPDASGLQQIAAAGLKSGLWRVKTEWTTAGKSYFAENSIVVR